ncbi:MAG: hypothetical protein AAF514_06445 [Verrucomicrobiota bacterium]
MMKAFFLLRAVRTGLSPTLLLAVALLFPASANPHPLRPLSQCGDDGRYL